MELYCFSRKRKEVLYFCRVIETQDWENEKCCGNISHRQVFPQLFWVLPNFHRCFYNLIEAWRTCFLVVLENTRVNKGKNFLLIMKVWILFARAIIRSTAHASSVFLWSYINTIFSPILQECLRIIYICCFFFGLFF